VELDDTYLNIIRHLRDGKKSYKAISQEMDITENTVRIRANKLIQEGVLKLTGLVDPLSMPNHGLAVVGVKLSTTDLIKKGEEFSKLKGVVSVGVCAGRYDLILIVLLNEGFPLMKFFTKEVIKVKDVQNAETFVVYHGCNFRVPYVL
jgi:Lrp/AsnC family transcriptional regulator for asnA, asnC and gidA